MHAPVMISVDGTSAPFLMQVWRWYCLHNICTKKLLFLRFGFINSANPCGMLSQNQGEVQYA
jgi:hypothetical protein